MDEWEYYQGTWGRFCYFCKFSRDLQTFLESDENFIEQFKKPPFFKTFKLLGKVLGVSGVAVTVLEFTANCEAEAPVVLLQYLQ